VIARSCGFDPLRRHFPKLFPSHSLFVSKQRAEEPEEEERSGKSAERLARPG
jgi:hypothetical protein